MLSVLQYLPIMPTVKSVIHISLIGLSHKCNVVSPTLQRNYTVPHGGHQCTVTL